MKSIMRLSVLFIFLLAGVFVFSSPNTQAFILKPENRMTETTSTPRALYLKNCARCHGADGKGDTETGKRLDTPDLTSEYSKTLTAKKISRVISKGKEDMPGFDKKLKAKDIASLVAYVRSL